MNLIEAILSRDEFISDPPILLDIGASGEVNHKWRKIARFSICLAFDADNREFNDIVKPSNKYKKLYIYNSLVADSRSDLANFYLTKSPYCSSLLKPDLKSLRNWAFSDLFEIQEIIQLKSQNLEDILSKLGIQRIDWFKTDSQGIDLRLFTSLNQDRLAKILVAEFEPGIIDAYESEDKLYHLLAYMQNKPFWMSDIQIQGSQRIHQETLNFYFKNFEQKPIQLLLKTSPGWGEVTYMNTLEEPIFSKRDLLLAWIFAVIQKQYSFALDLIYRHGRQFDDPIFMQMEKFVLAKIRLDVYKKLPAFALNKIFEKFIRIATG
jgi:hypothetical protein